MPQLRCRGTARIAELPPMFQRPPPHPCGYRLRRSRPHQGTIPGPARQETQEQDPVDNPRRDTCFLRTAGSCPDLSGQEGPGGVEDTDLGTYTLHPHRRHARSHCGHRRARGFPPRHTPAPGRSGVSYAGRLQHHICEHRQRVGLRKDLPITAYGTSRARRGPTECSTPSAPAPGPLFPRPRWRGPSRGTSYGRPSGLYPARPPGACT